jgi:hypothetical protein
MVGAALSLAALVFVLGAMSSFGLLLALSQPRARSDRLSRNSLPARGSRLDRELL